MDLRARVQHILAGDYDRARLPHPRWPLADLDELARAVLQRANRPAPFPDPRHVAVRNGMRLLARAPSGTCGEGTALGVIAFRWDDDPQTRGMRVAHGLSHGVLHDESGACNESDAWILTGCLVVPRERLSLARARIDLATLHAPLWLVMSRLIQANLATAAGF